MATFYAMVPPHYQQPTPLLQQDEPLWDEIPVMTGMVPDVNGFYPMQRYLHEVDQPLFTSRTPADYGTEYTLPGVYANPSAGWTQDPNYHIQAGLQRCPSPTESGPSPFNSDNSCSDRQSTPWSSPSTPIYSPEMATYDSTYLLFGGFSGVTDPKRAAGGPCVALTDVQNYADAQPEEDAYDEEPSSCFAFNVQEGYEPMQTTEKVEEISDVLPNDDSTPHSTECAVLRPQFRRRNTHDVRSVTSAPYPSRVTKRALDKKRAHSHPTKVKPEEYDGYYASISTTGMKRAFPCPFAIYGCQASFGSKNEWKRHVNTQHMRLGFWRCDLCDLGDFKTNDFNRKDLFIQHVRRMHPPQVQAQQQQQQQQQNTGTKTSKSKASSSHTRPSKNDPNEQELIAIANRCFHHTRFSPEDSGCLFCEARFTGPGSWDERLEHIGKHMEHGKKGNMEPMDPAHWLEDQELERWLEDETIIVESSSGYVLAEGLSA